MRAIIKANHQFRLDLRFSVASFLKSFFELKYFYNAESTYRSLKEI